MAQKLILPSNKSRLTASMKTAAYLARYFCVHYGIDLVSAIYDRTVYASGTGTVVACGWDSVVGNIVAVLYYDAYNRATGRYEDVIFRYYHLSSISVKKYQDVNKDTILGIYGNTGSMKMLPHLHLEADTDIAHPLWSPTVKSSSLLIGRSLGANDKTMHNPLDYLLCKNSDPDWQSYMADVNLYTHKADRTIEFVK